MPNVGSGRARVSGPFWAFMTAADSSWIERPRGSLSMKAWPVIARCSRRNHMIQEAFIRAR